MSSSYYEIASYLDGRMEKHELEDMRKLFMKNPDYRNEIYELICLLDHVEKINERQNKTKTRMNYKNFMLSFEKHNTNYTSFLQ